jgi:L-lyxonate dehydratase
MRGAGSIAITGVDTFPIRYPRDRLRRGLGEFLTTPLDIFRDRTALLPEGSVGLRGGPVDAVLVRVHTDSGLYGVGSVGGGSGAAIYIIRHHLAPIVTGQSPFDVELLWEKMYRSTLHHGRKGVVLEAISAIDLCLWDIIGKVTGQPLYNLVGGMTRDQIRVYASRLYANENLDFLGRQAGEFLEQGFTSMKLRFGYGPASGPPGMRKNLELVKTVRQVVGPDVDLMADAYMGWDVPYSIRMIRMLEDAGMNLKWIEEPVIPDDVQGYAQIRRAVRTAIAGGEHEFTRYGHHELIRREAVDILQPDVNRVGGITEAQKIWALASANDVTVIPHGGQLHNHHLVMAHMNSPMAEYLPPASDVGVLDDDNLFWELFTGEPRAMAGVITLEEKPGLGCDFNEERINEWLWRE